MEGQRNIAAVWPRGALLKCHKVQHQLNHTSSKRKWGGHFMWLQQQKRGHCFPVPHLFKSAPIEFVLVALPAFLSRIVRQPWSWPTDRLAHLYFFFVARFFFLKPPSRSLHLSPPSCRVCIWASSWCLPLLVRPRWQNFLWAVKDIWNVLWIENQWLLFLCCWEALVLQHLNWFHLFENPWGTIHHNITEGRAKHQCRCRR